MEILKITGPCVVNGSILCGGAKNLTTKLIIASILTRSVVRLHNVPNIHDVNCALKLCELAGTKIKRLNSTLSIDTTELKSSNLKMNQVTSRTPVLYLSALLHFFNEVSVPLPSGCPLGSRSLDIHVQILQQFGCVIEEVDNSLHAYRTTELIGTSVELPIPSVGATETALFLSVLARGKSILRGIAIEPEINSLILFLQACGAKITYTGERELTIEGTELHGIDFEIPGDRIEAASWACLACATGGEIEVSGINPEHLSTFLGVYRAVGGGFALGNNRNSIKFYRQSEIMPLFLETGPYPQLSTDYQPILASLLAIANGNSRLHETLFSDRLGYLKVFREFGVKATSETGCLGTPCRFNGTSVHSTVITGNQRLIAPDHVLEIDTIRSGFAYLILACASYGTTHLTKLNIIERGIENLCHKLTMVGVDYLNSVPLEGYQQKWYDSPIKL